LLDEEELGIVGRLLSVISDEYVDVDDDDGTSTVDVRRFDNDDDVIDRDDKDIG
jgi:hypothetical protein